MSTEYEVVVVYTMSTQKTVAAASPEEAARIGSSRAGVSLCWECSREVGGDFEVVEVQVIDPVTGEVVLEEK